MMNQSQRDKLLLALNHLDFAIGQTSLKDELILAAELINSALNEDNNETGQTPGAI